MIVDEVIAEVANIKQLARDSEQAHCNEDALYIAVLKHIARHCTDENCKRMAKEAIKARKIKFDRWYA